MKVDKLGKYNEEIANAEVILKVVKPETAMNKEASVRLNVPRTEDLFANKVADTFEEAIDNCVDALKRQLEKEASRYEEFLRAKYLFLDELGSEPERCQSYGTDYTPVQNLISYRYDRKLPTIVTTNIADDKILDRYGPRMMDRINEMFSILRFKGDSYRK